MLDVVGGFDFDLIPGKLQEARARKKRKKKKRKKQQLLFQDSPG